VGVYRPIQRGDSEKLLSFRRQRQLPIGLKHIKVAVEFGLAKLGHARHLVGHDSGNLLNSCVGGPAIGHQAQLLRRFLLEHHGSGPAC